MSTETETTPTPGPDPTPDSAPGSATVGGRFAGSCPLTQKQLIDAFFMEHRTKILDLAAFLDRLDRAAERDAEDDFRFVAFREALTVLLSDGTERAKRVQMVLSDRDTRLLEERDQQGAHGAPVRRDAEAARAPGEASS